MSLLLKCRALVLLTGLSIMWSSSWAEDNTIFTQQELVHDARQLALNLEQAHPDPYIGGGGKVAFRRRFQDLLEGIPAAGMTAEQFYRLLLPFVASLRDGHTAVLPPQTNAELQAGLPLTFKIIDESLAIAGAARKNNINLRGALLLNVEGIPLSELIQRQNSLRGIENVYGTLALLTRSLATERGLQILLPERRDTTNTRLTLRLTSGETKDFLFEPGDGTENPLTDTGSKVPMPDMSQSDVAWNFLDKGGQTALLKIDDMSSYREAYEDWIASGMSEGLEMARATYQKLHGRAAPERVDEILEGIPSATNVFKDLVVAMKHAGTRYLIVDLRENTGGNDLMVPMLLYFLFGEESMVSYDDGFQISRYSELYFQVYTNASLAGINHDRAVPLEVGDYDFSEEQARNEGIDPHTLRNVAGELFRRTPTFNKVFSQELYGNFYRPPHLVVLSSAWTYSSGFTMLAALEGLGATVVGTPSAHAGNNFGDSLLFQLPNTQLRGAVSFKQNVTFPDDPDKGRCLIPDVWLTHEKWASLNFDPNAEVLLALEYLGDQGEANGVINGSSRGPKELMAKGKN
jgi:hypothetical protein